MEDVQRIPLKTRGSADRISSGRVKEGEEREGRERDDRSRGGRRYKGCLGSPGPHWSRVVLGSVLLKIRNFSLPRPTGRDRLAVRHSLRSRTPYVRLSACPPPPHKRNLSRQLLRFCLADDGTRTPHLFRLIRAATFLIALLTLRPCCSRPSAPAPAPRKPRI